MIDDADVALALGSAVRDDDDGDDGIALDDALELGTIDVLAVLLLL